MRGDDERELVREAARRVLDGDGLMTIARDWNTRDVSGATGGAWTAPTLRNVRKATRYLLTGQGVVVLADSRVRAARRMGHTLADLGGAQSRLQALDDDFYVRGVLGEGRYRSIRVKLEREIDRLHAVVDAGTKQRIVLHPDPPAFWAEADFQQRRDLVRLMIQRVEVMPGRSALRRFDASRLRIEQLTWQSAGGRPLAQGPSLTLAAGSGGLLSGRAWR
ncbi:MAG: recombinase family protein [Actinomycetota bacterium]|nr:recombinase family protein [Actinomycetota bacterium]